MAQLFRILFLFVVGVLLTTRDRFSASSGSVFSLFGIAFQPQIAQALHWYRKVAYEGWLPLLLLLLLLLLLPMLLLLLVLLMMPYSVKFGLECFTPNPDPRHFFLNALVTTC